MTPFLAIYLAIYRSCDFKRLFLLAAVTTAPLFGFSCNTLAGPIRDRLKERVNKKLAEQPPPESRTDTQTRLTEPGDYTFSFSFGETLRYYKIHVPKTYKSAMPAPVLFAFHGGGGDMSIQATDSYYGLISKSENEGFIVVFPNGYSRFRSGKLATWNAGRCCGDARDLKIDDVGFIRQVFDKISRQLNVDHSRVFASGMSNGGMFAYRLACEASDIFKGIASVTGTDNTLACTPKQMVSILHIHAKDDDHVLYSGGAGSGVLDRDKVTEFTSVPATIAKWVKLNGCQEKPERILETKGATCDLYSACRADVRVQLCVTDKGGHSWPGGQKPRGRGSPSKAISATDVIWDFFAKK